VAVSPVSETSPSRLERASPEDLDREGIGDQLASVIGPADQRPENDAARVRARTPPEPVGPRFLDGRDDLVATPLHPLRHRVGQPPCACGRLHAESERAMRQARQLSRILAERSKPTRFLIRDPDQQFTDRCDDAFRTCTACGRRLAVASLSDAIQRDSRD
jgi:hypothetical protein